MPTIHSIIEPRRGCGYRKKGGLYLIGSTEFNSSCCKLPAPLTVCNCCGQGIKFSRGFTWIKPELIYKGQQCTGDDTGKRCPLPFTVSDMGLMWVGESFYNTPRHFMNEAMKLGISKRIASIPVLVEPGKTWIALAHRKCIPFHRTDWIEQGKRGQDAIDYSPGVFMLFKLQKIQYVVNGDETELQLQRMENRGIELVDVKPAGEQQKMKI